MLSTRFTELIGCEVPIQQAGMGAVSPPELVAAVSNAGGLGMLGTARWSGLEDGTYYLEIDVADQDEANLNGEVKITF